MDCLWALANFSNCNQALALKYIFDMGIVPILINLNAGTNPALIELPLRIIGNLLTGDDIMIDLFISYGIIGYIAKFLRSEYFQIRREAAWSLSNIASGTKSQILALINSGILPQVFELVKDSNADVVRESVWVFANCLTGSDLDLCVKLVKIGIMDPIIYTIGNHLEPSILVIALEGLKTLFSQGNFVKELSNNHDNPFVTNFINKGGAEYLEKLQSHKNSEVYKSVIEILDTHFTVVEEKF
jgi:importin subunit alpha-1